MNPGSTFLNPTEKNPNLAQTLEPPIWAQELVLDAIECNGFGVVGLRSEQFALATLRVPGAIELEGDALQQAVFDAYVNLWRFVQDQHFGHPVRIWNHVPRILADTGEGLDRYMRFNAGRHRAFDRWFGGRSQFDRVLPAASAVGHGGEDLLIHLLASRQPGTAVANPRQCAPHRYSRRFGPLPPCFSRAMLVAENSGRKLLMVGGTASIRGEESVHVDNLAAQLEETTENLKAVAAEGFASPSGSILDCYTDLRIYHPRALDKAEIGRHISNRFRFVRRVEWLQGDLCRSDLVVEVEALAVQMQR